MSSDSAVTLGLDSVLAAVAAAPPNAVVLIDGPSGSGKSTLADELVVKWPGSVRPVLVRLDDIYPGWTGLDAAARHLTDRVLRPRAAGRYAAWQRWDWTANAPAEWHPVDPGLPLVVEGCGSLSRDNVALSDVRVWIEAEDDVRKGRALARDGAVFAAHWSEWEAQWERYRARETPEQWADIRVFGSGADMSRTKLEP